LLGSWRFGCNHKIKLKTFVNGSRVFKLELIKLHQDFNNHARVKRIANAKDNLYNTKAAT